MRLPSFLAPNKRWLATSAFCYHSSCWLSWLLFLQFTLLYAFRRHKTKGIEATRAHDTTCDCERQNVFESAELNETMLRQCKLSMLCQCTLFTSVCVWRRYCRLDECWLLPQLQQHLQCYCYLLLFEWAHSGRQCLPVQSESSLALPPRTAITVSSDNWRSVRDGAHQHCVIAAVSPTGIEGAREHPKRSLSTSCS